MSLMNYLWPGSFLHAINKRQCAWRQRRKHFFAIQNGTVSIRKWGKQLRRISWIKFLISVSLTRVFVQNQPVWSGFGLWISNTLTVSVIRGYWEKATDTSAVAVKQDTFKAASPRSARFLRRATPLLGRLSWLKRYHKETLSVNVDQIEFRPNEISVDCNK